MMAARMTRISLPCLFCPVEIGSDVLKLHCQKLLGKFVSDAARARARPRIGQVSKTFGIRFAKRSHAGDCGVHQE